MLDEAHAFPEEEKAGEKGCRSESKTTCTKFFCSVVKETQNISLYGVQSAGLVRMDKGWEDKPGAFPLLGSMARPCPVLLQKVKRDSGSPMKVCCGRACNHSKVGFDS